MESRHGIRDAVPKVGDDMHSMALDQPDDLPHGLKPRVSGPPAPARPESLCLVHCGVGPQLAQSFRDGPRPPHLEIETSQGREVRAMLLGEGRLGRPLQLRGTYQDCIPGRCACAVRPLADGIHGLAHMPHAGKPVTDDLCCGSTWASAD